MNGEDERLMCLSMTLSHSDEVSLVGLVVNHRSGMINYDIS